MPTIEQIIEGSYKEGYDLEWMEIVTDTGRHVRIYIASIRPPWHNYKNGIVCNIERDMKKHYPNVEIIWS